MAKFSTDGFEDDSARSLVQRVGLLKTQKFTLLEDKVLCRQKGIGNSAEVAVPFAQLAPDPTHRRRIAYFAMCFVVLSIAACAFLVYQGMHMRRDGDGMYILAVFALIVFLVSLVTAVKGTFNIIVFQTTRGPLIIRNGRPDRDRCRAFVRQLQEAIVEHKSIERKVVIGVLRILRSEDFLDEWKYRKACQRFGVGDDRKGDATASA